MDELLHSPLVRFHYGWHNICRSEDALRSFTVPRNIHWSEYRWSRWGMNPIQSVSEVQTPNSKITTRRPLSKQINTHTADSWEQKNLCLQAHVNDCTVASYCCSWNTFKKGKTSQTCQVQREMWYCFERWVTRELLLKTSTQFMWRILNSSKCCLVFVVKNTEAAAAH